MELPHALWPWLVSRSPGWTGGRARPSSPAQTSGRPSLTSLRRPPPVCGGETAGEWYSSGRSHLLGERDAGGSFPPAHHGQASAERSPGHHPGGLHRTVGAASSARASLSSVAEASSGLRRGDCRRVLLGWSVTSAWGEASSSRAGILGAVSGASSVRAALDGMLVYPQSRRHRSETEMTPLGEA